MKFKYKDYLEKKRQPCPCLKKFKPDSLTAFRFMNKPATSDDFLPPAIWRGPKKEDGCNQFALSIFNDVENARKFYKKLKKRIDVSHLGDHIGKISVEKTDGLVCDPSKSGHFDLHEFVECKVAGTVSEYYLILEKVS